MSINNFKDLKIWQKGIQIAEKCYYLTIDFPASEKYGMTSQIRRAATSVPANIAEGYGRGSTKDYSRFLSIARGSLNELETHLIIAEKVQLATNPEIESICSLIQEEHKMLNSLIQKLA